MSGHTPWSKIRRKAWDRSRTLLDELRWTSCWQTRRRFARAASFTETQMPSPDAAITPIEGRNLMDTPSAQTATRMESPMKKLALALLHARNENLYPRLPRFVRRWVYTRTTA